MKGRSAGLLETYSTASRGTWADSPMTPFPIPEMTPPLTTMNFVILEKVRRGGLWRSEGDDVVLKVDEVRWPSASTRLESKITGRVQNWSHFRIGAR